MIIGESVDIPKRNDPSDSELELFEDYYARFPRELGNVPKEVVQTWMWYHNEQVIEFVEVYDFQKWVFTLEEFNNSDIMKIQHFDYDLRLLDGKGEEFIKGEMKGYDTADYMLANGTSPCPIIIAKNAGAHIHHQGPEGDKMLEPYHLIEGNRRLAYLRAMITSAYAKLKNSHHIWVVDIRE